MTTIAYEDAVQEQLPASSTLVYTCPATVASAHIIFGNCTNEDTTDSTLTVNIVQSGGAAGVTNIYLDAKTIAAGDTDNLSELINCVLKGGDAIYATAGDANRLNLKFAIKEIRS